MLFADPCNKGNTFSALSGSSVVDNESTRMIVSK